MTAPSKPGSIQSPLSSPIIENQLLTCEPDLVPKLQVKKGYGSSILTASETAAIDKLGGEGDVYGRLARSIAPEIFGHEDVKKVGGGKREKSRDVREAASGVRCSRNPKGLSLLRMLSYGLLDILGCACGTDTQRWLLIQPSHQDCRVRLLKECVLGWTRG